HWVADDGGFYGLIGELPVFVRQEGRKLCVKVAPPACSRTSFGAGRRGEDHPRALDATATIRNYFALDHQLDEICRSFPKDSVMDASADYCRGLRIIRQPKWECLATFICSSMKQVAHIRQISQTLRKRFGEPRPTEHRVLYTFPTANSVAVTSEKELRGCALGYRAKNLRATAKLVSSGEANLEDWSRWPDAKLRAYLGALPGVGPKVANCVMLFAYQRLRAFPIDVWIERVLRQQYFPSRKKVTAQRLREFSETYFGEHGGYAQQYLFHHARTALRKPTTSRTSGRQASSLTCYISCQCPGAGIMFRA